MIPSPSHGVWHLGPVPLRAYAICIIVGIVVAVWISERRWVRRGGEPGLMADMAVWGVPFGIVGARIYHVLTNPELYFSSGRQPVEALYVWQGGLGIWGGISGGAFGVWLVCRRRGVRLRDVADTVAPGIAVAQAVGRWGNWFNQELFGRPTGLPWGLQIDPDNRPAGYTSYETFHPTFLYESIWNLGLAGVLLWAGGRLRLSNGRLFALYVMGYTAGRGWIEYLRIDTANTLLGMRINVWTSLIVFLSAVAYFVVARPNRFEPDQQDNTANSPTDPPARTGLGPGA